MRAVRIVAVSVVAWGMAVALTLFVGGATSLGPVVLEITRTHGVHLGDVVVGVAAAGLASVVTALAVGVGIGEHLAERRLTRTPSAPAQPA